jgi:putative transferase (TIGR04331 family)
MKSVFINHLHDDLDKKKKYITSNLFVYSFYKKRKFNIKLINTGFKSTLYVDKSFKLIESKIRSYRQQISKKISEYNKIDSGQYNFRWGPILDSWLYTVLSKIIYETDVLEYLKKKNIPIYLDSSSKSFFFVNSWDVAGFIQDSNEYNIFFLNCILKKKIIKDYKVINHNKNFFFTIFLKKFTIFFIRLFLIIKKPILLDNSYFSKKKKINLFFRSLGSIIFSSNFFKLFNDNQYFKVDFESRLNLKIKNNDQYDRNFNKIFPYIVPINFYENFFNIIKNNDFFKNNISLLGSAINLHSDDAYKILCADISNKKRLKNVVFQHGGLYGLLKKNMMEDIERKYSDKFYSWNNKSGLGMHNLTKFKKIKKFEIERNNEICLFTTYNYPYMGRFLYNFCPDYYADSSVNINFYNKLNINIKNFFILRLFPHDPLLAKKDWLNILNIKNFDAIPDINKRFAKLKLFIADHISTPFFEAIFSGVPTIVYCDYRTNGFNKKFIKLLKIAEKNNIIHLDGLSAAKFINNNYINIFDWWNSKEVVTIRDKLTKYLFKENNYYYKRIIADFHKVKTLNHI